MDLQILPLVVINIVLETSQKNECALWKWMKSPLEHVLVIIIKFVDFNFKSILY